eukprot:1036435_1
MPWQYLILDSTNNRIVLRGIPMQQQKEFVTFAMNAQYQIKYFDSQNVQRLVEDVNIVNQNADNDDTALGCVPIQSNPLYSTIQVMVAPLESKSNDECTYGAYKYEKVFSLGHRSRYNINQRTPFQIDYKLNVHKFDVESGSDGFIRIHSTSDIIIQKGGAISANGCGLSFKYESDFDQNGVLYAIGTDFGVKEYENPAKTGLVDVASSEMVEGREGQEHLFIGRDDIRTCTNDKEGSYFYIDLKKYKLKAAAYTLKNSGWADSSLQNWNLEGSNDGETWRCLKKHESDDSLTGKYTSHTWTLNHINQFYSFFRIVMIGKAANDES